MAYGTRELSIDNIYHVMCRGVGRQLIFEDDADCNRYLELLDKALADHDVELYAWCLMGNHAHLLLHAPSGSVSLVMRDVGRNYARYFNTRHDHVGHVFKAGMRELRFRVMNN